MVAPTRAPQSRGVKCDLCKKILASATWLDQTKSVKNVEAAQAVLDLIWRHEATSCSCIPNDIGNLLIGSTYFEIHRLIAKRLDAQVDRKQSDFFAEARQRAAKESSKKKSEIINDCQDNKKTSRFRIDAGNIGAKYCKDSEQQLEYLLYAIDYWKKAMEDRESPFNAKLALRLGLTHHVIYACYLFKYHKKLDYQLKTAILLLNLFKSIESVTANAILHANYLLVATLIECNQLRLARQCLKEATKLTNYQDKSYYESILLTCMSCELKLLDNTDSYDILGELSKLAIIKPDDKLQHYYARALAFATVIKYIHFHPTRSELCFEFYHTFRYLCAIMRRCYESSFDLVLTEKGGVRPSAQPNSHPGQILDHSWIRFAVCDFAFSTFDLLSNFYIRSGQPESLELLFNGLNLVSYRTGSFYWQARLIALGASLDLLCDKYDHARSKLEAIDCISNQISDPLLTRLLNLDREISTLRLNEKSLLDKGEAGQLLDRIRNCQDSLLNGKELNKIELYDCKLNRSSKLAEINCNSIIIRGILGRQYLRALKIIALNRLRHRDGDSAREFIIELRACLNSMDSATIEYEDSQIILEILLHFVDIERSEQLLLNSVASSSLFIEVECGVAPKSVEMQLSLLTLDDCDKVSIGRNSSQRKSTGIEFHAMSLIKRGTYQVASGCEDSPLDSIMAILNNFESLTTEEVVNLYLRHSKPNPDYLLYRRANEILFCLSLIDEHTDHEKLLYHFCESTTANTMRYRWMMFEEQQVLPYEPKSTLDKLNCNSLKHLGFSEKILKAQFKTIPKNYKLVQFKYVLDEKHAKEHLFIVSLARDHINKPIYLHAMKSIESNGGDKLEALALPSRLLAEIEEAKKSLFDQNRRSRTEVRHKIERSLCSLLKDLEDNWLGPFRIILCGKIFDESYNRFVSNMVKEIQSIMRSSKWQTCKSLSALKLVIENAPLLGRDEFRRLIASLFGCATTCEATQESYERWQKMFKDKFQLSDKFQILAYLQTLIRGQVGLILDQSLELIPFESLPTVRAQMKQGIFRVPSLRLFNLILSRQLLDCASPFEVDPQETAYILDPAGNLGNTRRMFESKLKAKKCWLGSVGQSPETDQLERWLASKQVYIFMGHGAGTVYYNKLCKNRGLSAMPLVRAISIVMGCSSGRVMAEGPRLESFGISWVFIFRGSPSYVGLLWDVTDTDIDKFLDSLLSKWMGRTWHNDLSKDPEIYDNATRNKSSLSRNSSDMLPITDAVARARDICGFKLLIGSTPVVYGLPVCCKSSTILEE